MHSSNPHGAEERIPYMTDSSIPSEHSHSVWATVPPIDWQNKIMAQYFIASPQGTESGRIACEIIRAFDGYLKWVARSVWRRHGSPKGFHGLTDIESAGREGLVMAMQKWRPDRSKALIHLASVWIAGACKAEARRQARGAVDLPHKVRGLAKTYRILCSEGEKSDAEDFLRSSRSRTRTCQIVRFLSQSASASLSLSIPLPFGSEVPPGDLSDDLERSDAMASVRQCLMEMCSSRERLIFYLMHPDVGLRIDDVGAVEAKTGTQILITSELACAAQGSLSAIGKILGLSRERIRQINNETFQKIRQRLGPELHCS